MKNQKNNKKVHGFKRFGKRALNIATLKNNNDGVNISATIKRGSTAKSAPILKVNNITKRFGSFEALKGISFEIARGERIGLIGGNGAGKTTISEIIAGINKPTSGTIEYGFKFDESPKEGIGMQFQQSEYPSGLTVKDIIAFARNLRKLDITNEELKDLLNVFQMADFYTRKVRSLSGGQRQKLNILLSIIHNPKLVILDELSTGLDISAREEIIDFTDQLLKQKQMSAILISHHMAEIKALCSRVIILDNGEVRDIQLVKDIEKKHGSLGAYSKKLIAQSNIRLMEMEKAKKLSKENKADSKLAKTQEIKLQKGIKAKDKAAAKIVAKAKKEKESRKKQENKKTSKKKLSTLEKKVISKENKIAKKNELLAKRLQRVEGKKTTAKDKANLKKQNAKKTLEAKEAAKLKKASKIQAKKVQKADKVNKAKAEKAKKAKKGDK